MDAAAPMLPAHEFAERLRLPDGAIMRRIAASDILAHRQGQGYCIPESEVERFRKVYELELAESFADDF